MGFAINEGTYAPSKYRKKVITREAYARAKRFYVRYQSTTLAVGGSPLILRSHSPSLMITNHYCHVEKKFMNCLITIHLVSCSQPLSLTL